MNPETNQELFGILAEFASERALLAAARQARDAGYRDMDAYSPYVIEELPQAIGLKATPIAGIVLLGGVLGGSGAYLLQWWISVVSFPLNIGGRPLHSGPSFIPVTFEMTVLFAALFGLFGWLLLCRLPQPHHPVFNIPDFARASQDRFFLCIMHSDPHFDHEATRRFLLTLSPVEVFDVPR